MSNQNQLKADSRPQDYKALYFELLDAMENIGFSLQVQAKNTKAQAMANLKSREELLKQETEEKEITKQNAQNQDQQTTPEPSKP
jgi:hypothetical protein